MKKTLLVSAIVLALSGSASATSSKAFDDIMKPYEEIRLTLHKDSVEGVSERAESIRATAEEAAGASSTAEDVRPFLAEIAKSSEQLAAARSIEDSRAAFYEISKTMVQFRAEVEGGDLPVVMYCSMAKKSWLQLGEEVGNPYYGRSMPTCGNVVGEN